MAYTAYTGLNSPNQVLEKMADFITQKGYGIVRTLKDDLDIYTGSYVDGKKFAFKDKTGKYVTVLRSVNGTNVFGNTQESLDNEDKDENYQGIAMTMSEAYSDSEKWYNQFRVPNVHKSKKILGVFIPVILGNSYTLFCNSVGEVENSVVFTVMKENDSYLQVAHLITGTIKKYDEWEGGAYFSGSFNQDMLKDAYKLYEHEKTSDSVALPVLSSGTASNTFLRININDAPNNARGNIYWASSGTANETGKQLSLPIRVLNGDSITGNGEVPHYGFMQSKDRLDWGRNISTLNCTTVDLPIFMAVCVDPDVLQGYACAGIVNGICYVSTLNSQTGQVYEKVADTHITDQVFPMGKRRGRYGFDGISIEQ